MNGTGVLWRIYPDGSVTGDSLFSTMFAHTWMAQGIITAYRDLNCPRTLSFTAEIWGACLASDYFLQYMGTEQFLEPLFEFRKLDNRYDGYRQRFKNLFNATWSVASCQSPVSREEYHRRSCVFGQLRFSSPNITSEEINNEKRVKECERFLNLYYQQHTQEWA